jgi:hypothetical protein
LAIDSLEWGWERHPVIRLDLSVGAYSNGVKALHSGVAQGIREWQASTAGRLRVLSRRSHKPVQIPNRKGLRVRWQQDEKHRGVEVRCKVELFDVHWRR